MRTFFYGCVIFGLAYLEASAQCPGGVCQLRRDVRPVAESASVSVAVVESSQPVTRQRVARRGLFRGRCR